MNMDPLGCIGSLLLLVVLLFFGYYLIDRAKYPTAKILVRALEERGYSSVLVNFTMAGEVQDCKNYSTPDLSFMPVDLRYQLFCYLAGDRSRVTLIAVEGNRGQVLSVSYEMPEEDAGELW